MRTALTLNHWTRKSTALWPPSLLTAEEQMCGNAILSMEHQIPKTKFKNVSLFPNLLQDKMFQKQKSYFITVYSVVMLEGRPHPWREKILF